VSRSGPTVGEKTRHSYGPVHSTCIDFNPITRHHAHLTASLYVCQMTADLYIYPGDSGGSVFFTNASGITILDGIAWGYVTDGTGTYAMLSPIDGVHFDLGPFAACPHCSIY